MKQETYNQQFEKFHASQDGRFPTIRQLPCLKDDDSGHNYCPIYLYHTAWAARKLMQSRPARHIDIGSLTYFSAIASAITPITFYDIHPITSHIPGMSTGSADLTGLPFADDSIMSLSCMHVMEHIGLGRYGDNIDVQGDLKAAAELVRVLAPGGQLLMVLPVGRPKIEFNAHRIYSYEQVVGMFSGLAIREFTLVNPPEYIENASPDRVRNLEEGAGCFWFTK